MKHLSRYFLIGFLACTMTLSACSDLSNKQSQKLFDISAVEQDFAAHWLRKDLLVIQRPINEAFLLASENSSLDEGADASSRFPLSPIDQPALLKEAYPHLADFYAFELSVPEDEIRTLLKQQLAVLQIDKHNQPTALSYVQQYGVLDELYTSKTQDADEFNQFGAVLTEQSTQFSIWAPTATNVSLKLFDADKKPINSQPIEMKENPESGIWQVSANEAVTGTFFQYEVTVYHPATQAIETTTVTDPYSLSLSTNSQYSQVVDLNSSQTQPQGWQDHEIPEISSPESHILYEMHIRDFSAVDSALSNPDFAGKYAAFSETESFGAKHLQDLKAAGLNTLHLLPTYDLSTVNEDPAQTIYPDDPLEKICQIKADFSLCASELSRGMSLQSILKSYDPASSDAQDVIEQLRPYDPYNWGYDPYHYTVPEGSYALEPDGMSRIVEFRQMVQSIHEQGFRVIMDVVYNHTYASGLSDKSVLDKIVPNYYHRLHSITGAIEQSTCCDNTATEHRMMTKLMVDSLVVWARDYKIDGFRFDLMGHQPKPAMLESREAVRAVDPDTYFYGEGWNFGEVANNAQFIQASQLELAGTEIGTFTDRLRDAVRGGSSFVSKEAIRQGQGIGNGLITAPNELQTEHNSQSMQDEYVLSMDQVRIGLAANLADFPIQNAAGENVFGQSIDYGGGPAGYALDPADTVSYVSKHDNQTLWDNHQYRIASNVSTDDRVRMQVLSLAYPLMAQGIPFLHMGSELLRSKSFLRDSYDYGDWFNQVDFSKQTNNYNVGLPPKIKDGDNWDIIGKIIEANEGRDRVEPQHIEDASARFMDLLSIRTSSPLFRLKSAEEVIERVKFHNTGPEQQLGLIVMSIADPSGDKDLDQSVNNLIVIFNNHTQDQTFAFEQAQGYSLHPNLQNGSDAVVKKSAANSQGFFIPGLTVAVFVN